MFKPFLKCLTFARITHQVVQQISDPRARWARAYTRAQKFCQHPPAIELQHDGPDGQTECIAHRYVEGLPHPVVVLHRLHHDAQGRPHIRAGHRVCRLVRGLAAGLVSALPEAPAMAVGGRSSCVLEVMGVAALGEALGAMAMVAQPLPVCSASHGWSAALGWSPGWSPGWSAGWSPDWSPCWSPLPGGSPWAVASVQLVASAGQGGRSRW